MNRVLVIAFDFPPSAEVGAYSCAQVARYFPRYGWEPWVLTARLGHGPLQAHPFSLARFQGAITRVRALPHPLQLYSWLVTNFRRVRPTAEQAGGSRPVGYGNRGRTRRLLEVMETPDGQTSWIIPAVLRGRKLIRNGLIQHLFSSGPPWSNHLVGLWLARLTGLPWTVQFRDPWVVAAVADRRLSSLSRRLETMLERRVACRADSVVCVTEEHDIAMRKVYGATAHGQFVTIPNGYDEDEWSEIGSPSDEPTCSRSSGRFTITYTGTLYHRRSPRPLFAALKTLIETGQVDAERLTVEFVGWCDVAEGEDVRAMAARHGLAACVRLLGPLGRQETLRRLSMSDLLLILGENLTVQIPSKSYEYLRAGRPILALTSDGALASLLRRAGRAWVAEPHDAEAIVRILGHVYAAWKSGRPYPPRDWRLVTSLTRRELAGRYVDLFSTGAVVPSRPHTAEGRAL